MQSASWPAVWRVANEKDGTLNVRTYSHLAPPCLSTTKDGQHCRHDAPGAAAARTKVRRTLVRAVAQPSVQRPASIAVRSIAYLSHSEEHIRHDSAHMSAPALDWRSARAGERGCPTSCRRSHGGPETLPWGI